MIYGYIRVSTDKQDCDNQKLGIENKAASLGLKIDKYIEDAGISGTKEPEQRALGGMLRKLNPGDVIICSELSRLGRKMFMIMRILEHCMKIGARLYTVKDGYELGDTIQSKVLAFAFGLSAEIERNLIAQRTKEAMAKLRIQGIKLGRPCGQKNTCHIIDGHEDLILDMYSAGVSKRKIARTIRVSPPTISRFLESQKGRNCCYRNLSFENS
jgi:DNA invertase Pin-like site-specific DNA recombinase